MPPPPQFAQCQSTPDADLLTTDTGPHCADF